MDITKELLDLAADAREGSPIGKCMRSAVVEIEELRGWVVTFGAPWASSYGEGHYGSSRHLHPDHFDILKRCGARMDDFVRMDA